MTIAPIVAAAWVALEVPLLLFDECNGHQRCVYCGLVVREVVWFRGYHEYERCIETIEGLVCETCLNDDQVTALMQGAQARIDRKAIVRVQLTASVSRKLTDVERRARDADIMDLADEEWTWEAISHVIPLSPGRIGKIVSLARARRALYGRA